MTTTDCPACGATVQATAVFDERACPRCEESYWTFFDGEKPDPSSAKIQRNHDGTTEVIADER